MSAVVTAQTVLKMFEEDGVDGNASKQHALKPVRRVGISDDGFALVRDAPLSALDIFGRPVTNSLRVSVVVVT